jgi:glycine oxidase
MLSPGSEFMAGPLHAAEEAIEAFELFDSFSERTGITVHRCESLITGWTAGDLSECQRFVALAAQAGIATEERATNLPSTLSPRIRKAYIFPDDGFVDPDDTMDHLLELLAHSGVSLHDARINSLSSDSSSVTLMGEGFTSRFDRVVLATGTATQFVPEHLREPVRSIKGVTLHLQSTPTDPAMTRALINGRLVYVVQRPDGHVVVGASAEERDDWTIEAHTVRELLELASNVLPAIDTASFVGARVGHRPASASAKPFLKGQDEPVMWLSGFFRHGYLMSPLAYQWTKAALS